MSKNIAKVCMVGLNSKAFISLQKVLKCSAGDSENMIVDVEDLKMAIYEIENKEISAILKQHVEQIPNEVSYVWFYI